jgi:hypothetical protein
MSIKIKGYLFTGPLPIDKTRRGANKPETVFAVVQKAGPSFAPSFHLLDLGRTGAQGVVFAEHPHAPSWRAAEGAPAGIYLLDTTTQSEAAADLGKVVVEILATYTPPAVLK